MSSDGGKYDEETTRARLSTRAKAVLLIVLEGDRGNGFSAQIDPSGRLPPSPHAFAALLRTIAEKLEKGEMS